MADLMPCPSCKATLRLPEKAEAIRCPQCKTVVTLAKSKVAKAIPLPAPKAIPLPFDQPAAAPPQAIPVAKVLPAEKAVVRGKVVREEEEDDPFERQRRRRRRSEEELKEDPRYERVAGECHMARIGVQVLAAGAVCSGLSAVLFAGFLASLAIASSIIPELMKIGVALLGLHLLLMIAGFGFCAAGPRGMRSTAGTGIVVVLIHAGLLIPLVIFSLGVLAPIVNDATLLSDIGVPHFVFVLSSSVNNLNALTDMPWMIDRSDFVRSETVFVLLMVFGGLLEFAKMSILGTLVQYYASEGKGHELGFKSLRFVYRIIWVIIVAMLGKLAILILFRLVGGEPMVDSFFRIPQTLLTVAYFLWWTFAWFAQYSAMKDTLDIITPSRYLDKRLNLDEY